MVTLNTASPLPDADLARLVVQHWPRHLWIDALALVWPESGGRPDAAGDALHQFSADRAAAWRPYSCQGYTSVGLWQVHMPSHHGRLKRHSGQSQPCEWAAWLTVPANNAAIAAEIAAERAAANLPPLSAWTAWTTGASKRWRQRAIDALVAAGILPSEHDSTHDSDWYVVQPGDTLYGIAGRVFGDSSRWPELYTANRDVIGPAPDIIHPGQRLRIPRPSAAPTDSNPPPITTADTLSTLLPRLDTILARLERLIGRLEELTRQAP